MQRRRPGRSSLITLVWWTWVPQFVGVLLRLVYRGRFHGRENVPREGPVIYASNHQSHFDPVVVSVLVYDRPCSYLARESLFRIPLFGPFIAAVGAIPLKRSKSDLGALRSALDELKAGRGVLLFPEGTRTRDGALGRFRSGVALLQKRSKAPIVPVALEGLHDIWPHGRSFPKLRGRVAIRAGEPIPYEIQEREGADAMMDLLKRHIETMRLELRAELRNTTRGRYPAAGVGDAAFRENDDGDRGTPNATSEQAAPVRSNARD
jgi:1-acyl-sn-glycerol-3-phosphate acyltransferase